ncbi:glutamate receptor 3.6-like [Magnolia sinica]|uniref:glutamate receptor 3.6-like n=1 Tax=Magnolia sinica TaxID=86752 RepID=UPI002657C1A2|nr:glutamate receptor 3.6-like [Magnolia sinica]
MKLLWFVGLLVFCWLGALSNGLKGRVTSRPPFVNIGAIFTINSTIGRATKIAIGTAVEDVNADPSILGEIELKVKMQDSNCSGFLGIVEGQSSSNDCCMPP